MPKQVREWQAMHMARTGKPKVAHRFWIGAALHKRSHVRRLRIGANSIGIYPCWFTDDNEFTRRHHWHIGHNPGSRRRAESVNPRAISAIQGRFRISVDLTNDEIAQLEALAGELSVQEFANRAVLGLARTGSVCCHVDPASCMLQASRNSRRLDQPDGMRTGQPGYRCS